ncbi:hypothetical protein [Streptomyces sp. NPDC005989]|uniref:hypothetical protein n=1 Tax=Streptomyces sp. NPDC005989 TaxID=3156727 RepID=UPI0033C83C1F
MGLTAGSALRTSTGEIDLTASPHPMEQMAGQHAEAGADVVLPTAVLDGSVRTVRTALHDAGLRDVGVNSDLAIHTALYGPFRVLMKTDPAVGTRIGTSSVRRIAQSALLSKGTASQSSSLATTPTRSPCRPLRTPVQPDTAKPLRRYTPHKALHITLIPYFPTSHGWIAPYPP